MDFIYLFFFFSNEFKNKFTESSWVTKLCARKSGLRIEVIYMIGAELGLYSP
jgi:hypothetical protein